MPKTRRSKKTSAAESPPPRVGYEPRFVEWAVRFRDKSEHTAQYDYDMVATALYRAYLRGDARMSWSYQRAHKYLTCEIEQVAPPAALKALRDMHREFRGVYK